MKRLDRKTILAPFNEELPPQQRTEIAIGISELIMKIATHVICYTLVDFAELLQSDERISIAHAFLQRAVSTHLCNHKLTQEGIVYEYEGQHFLLHEEYKTMTLTRTVYEHLAMFYFLFEHPRNAEERDIVWKYWLINSKKNKLGIHASEDEQVREEEETARREIRQLKQEMLNSRLGQFCADDLTKLTNSKHAQTGSIEIVNREGQYSVNRLTFAQAWKYLYKDQREGEMMDLQYRYLSIHCHPVYDGLKQYQEQGTTNQGEDGIPLYFSCSFLAHLCRLFLRQIPHGRDIIRRDFNEQEQSVFYTLSQLTI